MGEIETASFLNERLGNLGFEFIRVGGVEKTKKIFAGDIIVSPRSKKDARECVLFPYFLESKKRATVNFWELSDKARDDADSSGKRGYIMFVQKQAKGEKVRDRKLVVMDWHTLAALLVEIQGYRNEEKHGIKS